MTPEESMAASYAALQDHLDEVATLLEAWLDDRRACAAIAEDCIANTDEDCLCLYCRTERLIRPELPL